MKIKNAPKVIYLQIGGDWDSEDFYECLHRDTGETGITWGEDKINDNDIRYVLDKRHLTEERNKKKEV